MSAESVGAVEIGPGTYFDKLAVQAHQSEIGFHPGERGGACFWVERPA